MAEDPERLIAEALRAQAARAPLPSAQPSAQPSAEVTQVNAAPGLGLAGSGYGLLSGSDLPLVRPAATERVGDAGETRRLEAERQRVPVVAILLFAAMLGLAAGAVVGLLTLV